MESFAVAWGRWRWKRGSVRPGRGRVRSCSNSLSRSIFSSLSRLVGESVISSYTTSFSSVFLKASTSSDTSVAWSALLCGCWVCSFVASGGGGSITSCGTIPFHHRLVCAVAIPTDDRIRCWNWNSSSASSASTENATTASVATGSTVLATRLYSMALRCSAFTLTFAEQNFSMRFVPKTSSGTRPLMSLLTPFGRKFQARRTSSVKMRCFHSAIRVSLSLMFSVSCSHSYCRSSIRPLAEIIFRSISCFSDMHCARSSLISVDRATTSASSSSRWVITSCIDSISSCSFCITARLFSKPLFIPCLVEDFPARLLPLCWLASEDREEPDHSLCILASPPHP
eukprot:Sspe_Gene.104312::Locus_80361_Transcript_1_1_Confidence_1.000_Length_1158::g.104312::m.104312